MRTRQDKPNRREAAFKAEKKIVKKKLKRSALVAVKNQMMKKQQTS